MTILQSLSRSVDAVRRRFSRRISGAALGVVVLEDTAGDLAALGSLEGRGRRPLVRTWNNGDPASAERILQLKALGYPLLVTIPFGKGFGPVGAGMTLQIDHEPDAQWPAVSPEQYGSTFRSTLRAMRQTIPLSIPIVTAGFSAQASTTWITDALMAGAREADAVCFHVPGNPDAIAERLGTLREAMARASCDKPLWITELLPAGWSHQDRADSLAVCLRLPALRTIPRVYISMLACEYADVIGLCDSDLARTPRPAFRVLRQAMRRP